MHRLNGHSALPTPSAADLILGELRSVRAEIRTELGQARQEVGETRGELRAGMRMLAANDRELFEQVRGLRERVSIIETRPATSAASTTGWQIMRRAMTWIGDVLPRAREIVAALLALAVIFGWIDPGMVPQGAGSPPAAMLPVR